MNSKHKITLILLITGIVTQGGCISKSRLEPVRRFESYRFDAHSSLASRVTGAPVFVLSYLMKLDNRSDYEPYIPENNEMKIIENAMASLPAMHQMILKKRLIGIYFVRNFFGNGLADWVVDHKKTVYTILVINSSVLAKNLTELLTEKEKTCFRLDDPEYDISIDCGKKYNGVNYILLHESTHAVDYVLNITPYTDRQYKDYMNIGASETEFTNKIWSDYDTSRERHIFSKHVFFYGSPKPQLDLSKSAGVYRGLAHSPFASLYGSLSWAEDLAELVTFYHITNVLDQQYTITVSRKGKKLLSVSPMRSPEVRKRLPFLQKFYAAGEL